MSRLTWELRSASPPFRLRGSHPLWPAFPDGSPTGSWSSMRSLNPGRVASDGLASSAFARHYWRNRFFFLLLEVLRCFTSLGSLARAWFVRRAVRRHYPPWVSPFGHLRIKAWLAAPRSLSQLPASFVASCRLGIHRVPFPAWSSSLLAPAPRSRSFRRPRSSPVASAPWLTGARSRHTLPTALDTLSKLRVCSFQRSSRETEVSFGPSRLDASPPERTAFDLSRQGIPCGAPELLRKEVIQPQVPLRLPCYDFTPVTSHSLGACLLAVGAATSGATDSHGVTGGVYKARERIHRGVLIRDY